MLQAAKAANIGSLRNSFMKRPVRGLPQGSQYNLLSLERVGTRFDVSLEQRCHLGDKGAGEIAMEVRSSRLLTV